MPQFIIFIIIGLAVGYSMGAGLIGAAVGFLVAKVIQMSSKIEQLERDLKALLAEQQASPPTVDAAKSNTAAKSVFQSPDFQTYQSSTSATETAHTIAENDSPLSNLELEALALSSTEPEAAVADAAHKMLDAHEAHVNNMTAVAQPAKASAPQPAKTTYTRYRTPATAQQPSAPTPFDKAFDYMRRFFTEGNPIVRIGMVVMFFGLSFLVKYASSQGMLPIELRLAAVCGIAVALIIIGWKTREKAGDYGLVLQGGGIAALYLTIFAAAKMYELMPMGFAFGLMFVIVMLGAALAVLQNTEVLALMATAGGFLAPIITSDGSGNHIGLFSFYLLLNIGILATAWFKTWRLLNWVGFVFTFVITSLWGVLKYEPHLYASTQPFLIAFFALYLAVSILFSLKQPPNLKGLVDGSLVFGLPIVGFGLQTALLKHTDYGLAISAIILAAIYIVLARVLWTKYQQTHRMLIESFIALGVTFATLTIPLAMDAQWTSASWALEAAGLIWVGLRQQRLLPRIAGYLLHIGAAISLMIHGINTGDIPIVMGDFISLFILSVSALCIAYLLWRFVEHCTQAEKGLSLITMIVGWLWWLGAGYLELQGHLPGEHLFSAVIVFFIASALLFLQLSKKIQWPQLAQFGFWLLPLTALWALRNYTEVLFLPYDMHPTKGFGWLAFALFFAMNYYFLWQKTEQDAEKQNGLLRTYHVFSAWFLCGLVYWEASWWQAEFNWYGTSAAVLWFTCLIIPLTTLVVLITKNIWPFNRFQDEYKHVIPAPLLLLLFVWFVKAITYSGVTTQFYLPILNPLDLAQIAVVVLFAYEIKRNFIYIGDMPAEIRYSLLGGLTFIWINLVLLRAIHHYTGIAYDLSIMWDSVVVQMALSILWAVCALVVMNISRRLQIRQLWMVGAGLLGIIVAKLAFKDLSGAGTLAGIISFVVVGALMLIIGYLSPIPAKAKTDSEVTN